MGTTDSNGYLSSVLLLEYGTYYVAAGSGIATINVATGQIDPHSSIFGPAGSPVALAPDPLTTPTPAVTLVANAEGGVATIAPNTWVEIKGSNLGPAGDTRIWRSSDFVDSQLPTSLDGLSVTVNGVPAYVYYISPTQVNILTPPNAISGSVPVQVSDNGVISANFMVQAQAESPSFFVFGGGPYIAATHANGSYIGPTSLYPGLTTPAQPGETIVMYANGFGSTSTPVVSGSETQSGTLSPMPVITIGGVAATVTFAGLVAPGEFQFNVVVPPSLANGDQPTMAMYNGLTTQAGTLITVQGDRNVQRIDHAGRNTNHGAAVVKLHFRPNRQTGSWPCWRSFRNSALCSLPCQARLTKSSGWRPPTYPARTRGVKGLTVPFSGRNSRIRAATSHGGSRVSPSLVRARSKGVRCPAFAALRASSVIFWNCS